MFTFDKTNKILYVRKTELKILELVNSPIGRDREKGVELFIKTYEAKSKNWIIKMG